MTRGTYHTQESEFVPRPRRALGVALLIAAAAVLLTPLGADAHGVASKDYETTINSIQPAGLPIEAKVVNGDQLRVQNLGDEELTVCGYVSGCEPYAKLGPDGVFVNHNSQAYYANLDAVNYGDVPDDAGKGAPNWVRVRREPAFLAYHDHRVHWMGGTTLPPSVDSSKSGRQKVTDGTISLRYGKTPVTISATIYYIGGSSFLDRNLEYLIAGVAFALMLVVFILDARRRRQDRPKVAVDELPPLPGATE